MKKSQEIEATFKTKRTQKSFKLSDWPRLDSTRWRDDRFSVAFEFQSLIW